MKYGSKRNWALFSAGIYSAAYGYGSLLLEPCTYLSAEMRGLGTGIICATVLFPVAFASTFLPSVVYGFVTKKWSALRGALLGLLLSLPLLFLNAIVAIGILCVLTAVILKPKKEKDSQQHPGA